MDGEREEEKGSEIDVWATRDPLTVIVTEVDGSAILANKTEVVDIWVRILISMSNRQKSIFSSVI